MEAMLSVKEAADLMGYNPRSVRRLALSGKINSEQARDKKNRPVYLIPISALEPQFQKKYYTQQKQPLGIHDSEKSQSEKQLDLYSEEEREEISFWTDLVSDWRSYRSKSKSGLGLADQEFEAVCRIRYPEREISTDMLRRRWKSLQENDLEGLIDRRGKHRKGKTTMDSTVWDVFLCYYLDQACLPISECLRHTTTWVELNMPELRDSIPDYSTFTRRVKQEVPDLVEILGREGEKAYRDRGGMYIRRIYEGMESNDWWICDNHTLDIISEGADGQRHRLYLTAFFDARSGIFVGCYVTAAPSSQSTLYALRKAILEYGIPQNILGDNGREFLTHDLGGLGHRQKKTEYGKENPYSPPIFKRLGINFTTAQVRNARAKPIERAFLNVKNQISRLFQTYTGGNVTEKPERLKHVLKIGKNIPTDEELTAQMEELLRWYFNEQPYGGAVTADRGKPRMQVYNEQLRTKRVAAPDDLNLMLMRSTRPQTVGRRGVCVKIAGERIDYTSTDLKMLLFGQKVYLRYDPEDMREVRVYDLKDRFLMTAPAASSTVLTYGADKDSIADAVREVRSEEKVVKEALRVLSTPAVGKTAAIDMALARAKMNREAAPHSAANPKILEIQRVAETPVYQKAVGALDLEMMVKNAMKRQGGLDDGEGI